MRNIFFSFFNGQKADKLFICRNSKVIINSLKVRLLISLQTRMITSILTRSGALSPKSLSRTA